MNVTSLFGLESQARLVSTALGSSSCNIVQSLSKLQIAGTGLYGEELIAPSTSLVRVNDVPRFVNNDIDEFEKGDSNSKVGFIDGSIISLVNKKNTGTSHLKLRGGKTKAGRLIPTQRLGRIGEWWGMDATGSDTSHIQTQAYNVAGTQQSQVIGVGVVGTSNEAVRREGTRTDETARNDETARIEKAATTKEAATRSKKATSVRGGLSGRSTKDVVKSKTSKTKGLLTFYPKKKQDKQDQPNLNIGNKQD